MDQREDIWSIVHLGFESCHSVEVPCILKSIQLVLRGYFNEGWFDLGAHREPMEYNLEMVYLMYVEGQEENAKRVVAWAVRDSETVMK